MAAQQDDLDDVLKQAERALDLSLLSEEILEDRGLGRILPIRPTIILGSESEEDLQSFSISGAPQGIPLYNSLIQIEKRERTELYKSATLRRYRTALRGTASMFQRLVGKHVLDYEEIQSLVGTFMDILERDRALLLNLASIREFQKEEDYLYSHALNVCLLTLALASATGYSREGVIEIGVAGLLLDLGMACIDPKIRFKTGDLSSSDRYEIHKHPLLGMELLQSVHGLPFAIALAVYQHHERESGIGYPKNRKSHLIHPYSKLVSISDVFEALASPRQYRKSMLPYKAMEILLKQTSEGHYQSASMRAFIKYLSLFPIGSLVRLSTGSIAKVIGSNGDQFDKPIVSLLTTPLGQFLSDNAGPVISLSASPDIRVIEPLSLGDHHWAVMDGF